MNKQLIAVGLLALSSVAGAQSLKPGLWEITHKTEGSGNMAEAMSRMHKEMANASPEQRKMMEDMMASHGARPATGGAGGGMTIKMCMTKEMAERNQVSQQRSDCTTTMQPRTGNTIKMSFTCTNPPSSGDGQLTFASPEAYNLKMTVNTNVQGKPETMNLDTSGKWLGADCGSVKPIVVK